MSANIKSMNDISVVEAMILDDHDSAFNPVHSKMVFKASWMIIVSIILVAAVAACLVVVPASALYTRSVPGASNVMALIVVAGAAGFIAIVLAAGFAERHYPGYKLAKVTLS